MGEAQQRAQAPHCTLSSRPMKKEGCFTSVRVIFLRNALYMPSHTICG